MSGKSTNPYGLNIKPRVQPVRPAELNLDGEPGERIVKAAAHRIIARHKKVLKALVDR
ncbi:hypothetical protein LH435_13665 [Laribacter hongkongensis]|uniref:hypothetical protein n=1 Tax=Laribacter hongkongensis TaxID=168471 RepID=UPI001EFC6F76|nr:hypothetical protein [Laribacter hongkongensis]MCG8995591.1 hypothetical protein [Laribacter hongkongensis]MCG9009323.1 hypothetical protein [Laribacter hongkongensis]MCG9022650.1 hypothetical protein [Laribacter hongkongensis]MCG9045609.1 hypothetical protein [Laribacter hongkongensis]MCG9075035.1 hypothetical protein [Laribacter hongkongensis]